MRDKPRHFFGLFCTHQWVLAAESPITRTRDGSCVGSIVLLRPLRRHEEEEVSGMNCTTDEALRRARGGLKRPGWPLRVGPNAASCDTRPKGGDATKIAAPFTSGTVASEAQRDAQ